MPWVGVVLFVVASFACAALLPREKCSPAVVSAFFVYVLLHHGVSFVNALWVLLPGADFDAHYFHINALRALEGGRQPQFTLGTGIYEWMIFSLYSVFGPDKLLAQSMNVLFSALSCVLIVRITLLINSSVSIVGLVGVLAITPSLLFFTSITFREVYQLFGLLLGCFAFLYSVQTRKPAWMGLALAGLLFMGVFHHVILAYAVILFSAMVMLYVLNGRQVTGQLLLKGIGIPVLVVLLGALLVIYFPAGAGNDYLEMFRHAGGIREMIETYRSAVDSANPRTSYGFEIGVNSSFEIAAGLARSYLYYLFGPWPNEIEKTIDLVPVINSVIRALGVLALIYLIVSRSMNRKLLFLVIVFLTITFLWSMGTTNYGQAFRHNAMTDWILVIGCFVLLTKLRLNLNQ